MSRPCQGRDGGHGTGEETGPTGAVVAGERAHGEGGAGVLVERASALARRERQGKPFQQPCVVRLFIPVEPREESAPVVQVDDDELVGQRDALGGEGDETPPRIGFGDGPGDRTTTFQPVDPLGDPAVVTRTVRLSSPADST